MCRQMKRSILFMLIVMMFSMCVIPESLAEKNTSAKKSKIEQVDKQENESEKSATETKSRKNEKKAHKADTKKQDNELKKSAVEAKSGKSEKKARKADTKKQESESKKSAVEAKSGKSEKKAHKTDTKKQESEPKKNAAETSTGKSEKKARGADTDEQTDTAKTTAAKSIKISGSATVLKGATLQLTAKVSPKSASQNVTWKSSNTKVATVSSNGVVTGKKAGSVTITATSKTNKKIKATYSLTVIGSKAKKVTLNAPSNTLSLSQKTMTLTAKASPADALQKFSWKSSNTKVATVDNNGVVTAKKAGTVKITATAKDGSKKSASVKLKIVKAKNIRFDETKKITVEIFDRSGDNGADATDNVWTDYIKKSMLEKYNIAVEFVSVGRWSETDEITEMLAASNAADVSYTYGDNIIRMYADMGGVTDLAPYLDEYKEYFGNIINQLGGEQNLYYDRDPESGAVYMLEGAWSDNARTATFIRKDWLDKLGLKIPTTEEEFHDCLIAFRDNATKLLGKKKASKMVPYSTSTDIAYRNDLLSISKVAENIDDASLYVYGADGSHFLYPGYKNGIRVLNQWYNEGLIWKDFGLYNDSTVEDENMKAGYVGAFQHNWDYPFRNGDDSINANLKRNVGDDAMFVAVDCFTNDAGITRKYLDSTIGKDRKIFLPSTNDEPLASLLYIDFISDPETIKYLQTGKEGVNYKITKDGAYQMLAPEGKWSKISGNNLDYTITCNGLSLGDATEKTLALYYENSGTPAETVIEAHEISKKNGRVAKNYSCGINESEIVNPGSLNAKRDELLNKAVTAPVKKFDAVYSAGLKEYLKAGGQKLIDERTGKLKEFYGLSPEKKLDK